jgi:predicted dehydrogenase
MDEPAAAEDDPLRNEQDHFLTCVGDRSRKPALVLSEALAGLKLADAAIESLSLDREVMLSA